MCSIINPLDVYIYLAIVKFQFENILNEKKIKNVQLIKYIYIIETFKIGIKNLNNFKHCY